MGIAIDTIDNIIKNTIKSFETSNSTNVFCIYEKYLIDDYFDARDCILIVDTEDEASKIVNALNDIKKSSLKEKEIYNEFSDNWEANHKIEYIELVDIPKWSAGLGEKDITDTMRTKRRLLQEKNLRIKKKNDEAREAYTKLKWDAYNKYAKDNNLHLTAEKVSILYFYNIKEYEYGKITKI